MAIAGGTETLVNTSTPGYQSNPVTVALLDGGWVVTWSSYPVQDGGIYQQVYNADGTVRGAEMQVNTYTPGAQQYSTAIALSDGGWVVIWRSEGQDGSYDGVYQQAFYADGTQRGSETQVNTYTASSQAGHQMTALPDGGWVVIWRSNGQDGSSDGVYQQIFNDDGSARGGETQVNTYTENSQTTGPIVTLSDGGWVVTWSSYEQDGSGYGAYQQAYNADGSTRGEETRINVDTDGQQYAQLLMALPDGGWVTVVQHFNADHSGGDIFQQVYNADGTVRGDYTRIHTHSDDRQMLPQINALPGGGWVTVWQSNAQDGSGYGIYQQAFNADGSARGTETQVNTHTAGAQSNADVTLLSNGGWVVTWQSGPYDGCDFYQQVYNADGTTNGAEILVSDGTMRGQGFLQVTALHDESWVVSWAALDGDQDIHQRTFWVNDAPTVENPIARQVATEDQTFSFVIPANTFGDADALDTLTYSAELRGGGELPDWLTFDPATGTFSGTPQNGDIMSIVIRVTATDAGGEIARTDFVLSVQNVNDAPTVQAPVDDQVVTVGASYSQAVASAFEDVDLVDILTYSAALADGGDLPDWLTLDALTGTFSGTPGSGDIGPITVRVTAIDISGEQVSTDFTLTVNDKPIVANAISGQTATEDVSFTFVAPADTFDDQVLDTLTYTATLASGAALPSWLAFDPASRTFSGTPANGDVGSITIRLTATDAGGAAVSTDFTLGVGNINDIPTLPSNGTASVFENAKLTLDVLATAVDVDAGNTLILLDASLSSGFGSVFIQDGKIIYDPTTAPNQDIAAGGIRTVVISYIVSDDNGGIVSADITVTVKGVSPDIIKGGSGNDTLTGSSLADELYGYEGADLLDGRGGADKMVGGADGDTYVVENTGDTVIELANGGYDAVQSSISYTLGANVEVLTLTGTSKLNATGNGLNNVLTGNSADNVLDGKAGGDTLKGGAGNDTYIVDDTNDYVAENASQGTDLVKSSVSYWMTDNVENLTLTGTGEINGTGNSLANVIVGNTAKNWLDGGSGTDRLDGGGGNDNYVVDNIGDVIVESAGQGTDSVRSSVSYTLTANVEYLTLAGTAITGIGNELANSLSGNASNNTLDGKAGADGMYGGAGNDTYVVDNAKDLIVESSGQGTDIVKSSVSYVLSANVEHLTLTGTAKINATGNELANTLTGNDTDNTLDGKAGADRLVGLKGNDTYIIDNAKDVVVEAAGQGTDLVKSSVSYTLSANVENLTLTGTAVTATGNELANAVTGNASANTLSGRAGDDTIRGEGGNDRLIGEAGADKLYGGSGADTFVFKAVAETTTAASGMDMIYDFSRSQGDRIDLSAIDANLAASGNNSFSLIGTEGFHKKAGELRYEIKSGDTYVYGDIDGNGKADFAIRFDASIAFTKDDFLL